MLFASPFPLTLASCREFSCTFWATSELLLFSMPSHIIKSRIKLLSKCTDAVNLKLIRHWHRRALNRRPHHVQQVLKTILLDCRHSNCQFYYCRLPSVAFPAKKLWDLAHFSAGRSQFLTVFARENFVFLRIVMEGMARILARFEVRRILKLWNAETENSARTCVHTEGCCYARFDIVCFRTEGNYVGCCKILFVLDDKAITLVLLKKLKNAEKIITS